MRSPRSTGRRLVECLLEAFSMAPHASQFIVLVQGLSGTIACKLSSVDSTTPRRTGTFLNPRLHMRLVTSSWDSSHTIFYYYLNVKVSTQTLGAKDLPAETAAKSMIGRKLVDNH